MAVRQSSNKPQRFILSLIFLSLTLLLLTTTTPPPKPHHHLHGLHRDSPEPSLLQTPVNPPRWYEVISKQIENKNIKIALVNIDEKNVPGTVKVDFDRINDNIKWEELFPEWIDEDRRWGPMVCPEIPMPGVVEEYENANVVVAGVPCSAGGGNDRDVFRLQVNLVVANLTVRSGFREGGVDRTMYVVFVGSCGPMREIFRCEDLMWHEGEYWVYKPDLKRLKQKVLMPVGSCMLAPPFTQSGREVWRPKKLPKPREAYVTILHSSETYVCGAIALAQSIIQTHTTRDLLLLADDSISPHSLHGLKAAGWKIKHIQRIRSPHAEKGSYNEWNYSKLRIWQLTEYEKIIFIDADLIVLRKMDHFFIYPQLSATGNDKYLFNSGVMLVEPSTCTFKTLMEKRFTLGSYNGGDQGFLNEVFTWWHRWHSSLNHLKVFVTDENPDHIMPEGIYTIHYLGLKPWMCYEDYDCNWDMLDHHPFASDDAHRMWWKVYNSMDKELRPYCALTKKMDERIRKWRGRAKSARFADGHWNISVKDGRQWHGL
ncbi:hypothetical protein LguiA_026245 [Lonicera macranthoides]